MYILRLLILYAKNTKTAEVIELLLYLGKQVSKRDFQRSRKNLAKKARKNHTGKNKSAL